MGVPEAVRSAYDRSRPSLEELARYVEGTLTPYAHTHGYTFKGRIKALESVSEKIETGRYQRWSDLDDLYGCTLVVPVSAHEAAVTRKLEACFDPQSSRSRESTEKAPDVFRFDGLRWYGKIREDVTDLRQPGLSEITFEVQVQTAFEHAWQVVTHDLVYKADSVDWSRQRLASQLKAGVEQIETVIEAFESAAGAVRTSPWKQGAQQAAVIDFFKELEADGLVPQTLIPASWRRFSESFIRIAKAERLGASNEESINELLNLVNKHARGTGSVRVPVSGSLLQLVLGVLAAEGKHKAATTQPTVDSAELRTLYHVDDLQNAFVFDGSAIPTVAADLGVSGDAVGEAAPA